MCAVSNVMKDWMDGPNRIPDFSPFNALPQVITPNLAQQMLDVLAKLSEIDRRLGAIDCKLKAPFKAKMVRKLKRRANGNTARAQR